MIEKLLDAYIEFGADKLDYKKEEQGRLAFIEKFPLTKLKTLTIDEYCPGNGDDSFCYWLEFKNILMGIGGGSAGKFGLYKDNKHDYRIIKGNISKKLSLSDAEIKFDLIIKYIIKCLELVENDEIEKIIDLNPEIWNMVLIKILLIYFPDKFVSVGRGYNLVECAKDLNLQNIKIDNNNIVQINHEIRKLLNEDETTKFWNYDQIGHIIMNKYQPKFWIFQGKQSVFDTISALKENKLTTWSVNQHKAAIEPNDKFILWLTDKESGCYALGTVISKPTEMIDKLDQKQFYQNTDFNKINYRVEIRIDYNFVENPIKKDEIQNISILGHFIKGQQGTNLKSSREEFEKFYELSRDENSPNYWLYVPGENAKYWDDCLNNKIACIGWDALGDLKKYKSVDEIRLELTDKINNTSNNMNSGLACFEFSNKLKIGDILFAKTGTDTLLGYGIVDSEYFFDDKRTNFKNCVKVIWKKTGNWKANHQLVLKTLTNITKYRTDNPLYTYYFEHLFGLIETPISNITNINITTEIMKIQPLNQILYGPPGTGKTYNTINRALEILGNNPEDEVKFPKREIITDKFKELLYNPENGEGQIAFTTFHQSMSYEDFVEGIKPLKPEEDDEFVKYEVVPGIFKNICESALKSKTKNIILDDTMNFDLKSLVTGNYFYKLSVLSSTSNSELKISYFFEKNVIGLDFPNKIDLSEVKNLLDFEKNKDQKGYDLYKSYFKKFIDRFKINDIVLLGNTKNQIVGIARIKSEYNYSDNNEIGINHFRDVEWLYKGNPFPITDLLTLNLAPHIIQTFSISCIKSINQHSSNQIKTKVDNYVLIIDEINRGNVSQIFGELITLIEDDKRAGKPEALKVILPYSKTEFEVPPNLYIIGTMNTADRSVEALDSALRRRFSFEEMPPNYDLVELQNEVFGFKLGEILNTLNDRIEILLDKDHLIGHSYFIDKDEKGFITSFNDKIIPLLQEYFYGDYGKISLILGKNFVKKENAKAKFAASEYDIQDLDQKEIWRIERITDVIGFTDAIKELMA